MNKLTEAQLNLPPSESLDLDRFKSHEEQFHLLVESVKDYAIYLLDSYGNIITWNTGAERINGWKESEIIGKSVTCLFPPRAIERRLPQSLMRQARVQGSVEFEDWRMRRDGSQFWANVTMTALKDENEKLLGFATVTRDITERKQAEEALQQAYDELERRVEERTAELVRMNEKLRAEVTVRQQTEAALRNSQAHLQEKTQQLEQTLCSLKDAQIKLVYTEKMSSLGSLAAGMAHEINNPLSFIYGNLDHLRNYAQDLLKLIQLYQHHEVRPVPEIQAAIEEIDLDFLQSDLNKILTSMRVGVTRIQQIVRSLQTFSRPDECRDAAQLKKIDLHAELDRAIATISHQQKGSDCLPSIQFIREYGNLPKVECSDLQVHRAFVQILKNAIDAISLANYDRSRREKECPTIWIRTQAVGKTVRIAFQDNGIGMSEATRKRIFDPFFTTKAVGQGAGLGLWICYQTIVKQHQGRLHCLSTPDRGTQLIVELPIEQYQPLSPKVKGHKPRASSRTTATLSSAIHLKAPCECFSVTSPA
ncbi:MAG TPA: PAS domain S-box protein [Oscillatoriales cyanobacterium M59_W2019_021]|nr:MAG: PAS domain-containing sensor histidine kinase [Cyanobacteria bacterium J055]HIK30000.1 PAS domain S-box protein [Oscillatoriales cyanobacterium M4454_W2019_049]HIK49957.1 PAS domain S-box protein [Oscillatoriales cyanobacterium M59_W2019_021]